MSILWGKRHDVASNLDRKAAAAAVVHSHGVPHRRIEEWKYSDLKSAWAKKAWARWWRNGWWAICPAGLRCSISPSPIRPPG
jgi:hypothetical protein